MIRHSLSALALTCALITPAIAQTNGSNSPYSRYGFGLLNDRAGGFNKAMSGLSYGMRNGKELNTKNPASYSAIDSLSFLFDMGFSLSHGNLQEGKYKVNAKNSSYDYLTMGFRAAPNLGISLGLIPFSTVGYNITRTTPMVDNIDITQTGTYSGDGGLHEVYLGAGWKPFNHLSVGFNAAYLWGDITHTVLASFSDANIASRRRQYTTDIRSYKLDFGLQWEQQINKKNALVLGLTYGLGHPIDSKAYYYDQKIESGTAIGDTLVAKNAFELPHTFGAGLTWLHRDRLRIGVDYTLEKWADVKYPILNTDDQGTQTYQSAVGTFTDLQRITLGAEYIPNPNGIHRRDLIRYRFGASYATPYTRVDGLEGPKNYQVSLGVGLPIINFHNNRSLLNVAVQYERVEPKFSGMITENYFRLCIGLSFNERWFMKWKVN